MNTATAGRTLIDWLIAADGAVAGTAVGGSTRADLVIRARSGDPEAFETLIRAAGDHLLAIARKILRDPEAAEDALQQAIIRAWRKLPQLRDPGRFDAWIYRILVMCCFAEANRARRFRQEVHAIDAAPVEHDFAARIADREVLERAFVALTPSHRAVIVLHYFAGLPLTDVARIVGVSHGTVRSRLHYALREMRSALDALDRGTPELSR